MPLSYYLSTRSNCGEDSRGHKFVEAINEKGRRIMALGVVAAAAISAVVMVPLLAAAQQTGHSSSKSTLQERKVGKYGEVLTNSAGYSLYVLSTEQKGKLHCTSSSCLGGWPPLLIGKNAMISAGPGVVGKVSHVARGSKWQVTYNGGRSTPSSATRVRQGLRAKRSSPSEARGTSHAQQQRPIPLPGKDNGQWRHSHHDYYHLRRGHHDHYRRLLGRPRPAR